MALRPYVQKNKPSSEDRILEAAEASILDGTFHQASVASLAERAGVARATVFGRFRSKLGVLESLSTRCSGGPEMRGIREAFAVDDPREAVVAVVAAACALWERQGHILVTLKAIVELEPDAGRIIAAQREDQASSIAALVRRLDRAGGLRAGLRPPMAGSMLHMVTSVEAFLELRRHGGHGFEATKHALTDLAKTLLA